MKVHVSFSQADSNFPSDGSAVAQGLSVVEYFTPYFMQSVGLKGSTLLTHPILDKAGGDEAAGEHSTKSRAWSMMWHHMQARTK